MRFRYIAQDGTEQTVASIGELADAIKRGDLLPDQQLFDSSIGRWTQARSHDAAAAVFATLASSGPRINPVAANRELQSKTKPPLASPNRRIVARFLDSLILGVPTVVVVSMISTFLLGPPADDMALRENNAFWAIVSWLGVLLLDPYCTLTWGGTPGKLLLGMRVRSTVSSDITSRQAWRRAFLMWMRGLAFGIPLIQLIPAAIAMRKVAATGSASWDDDSSTVVIRTS